MVKFKWNGVVNLPTLPERKERIGCNKVIQHLFAGINCESQILDSSVPGHDLIRTNLTPPYHEFHLRRKGAQRQQTSLPVVTSLESESAATNPEQLTLRWDNLKELASYCDTPGKVLDSWKNKFVFRAEDEIVGTAGLRNPQIGALHAIAAHFSVGDDFEAATIVLPTGTGKTETMLATLVYRRLERVLVLVPSDTLRKQIGEKFVSLGVLPDAGVIPHELPKPRVAIVNGGIKTVAEAQSLIKHANVVVALPNSLQVSDPDAVNYLINSCTDLFVDEAHHIAATTWNKIFELFKDKRIIQFTATPFMNDGKRIEGKIIFNYKLGDAQTDGYYRPINLRTVEEFGDQNTRDSVIAETAIDALRRDIEELNLDHLLMARTRTKARAEDVVAIYRELAPDLNPVNVYSGPGRNIANKEAMESICNRTSTGSRIIVCVDMLGEGFDLPNLKIAALHDTHKSLAITLQFIGRFTRKGNQSKIGEATVVANIADEETESKLEKLYAEGADWDLIIRQLSEEHIESELQLQDVVSGLKEKGSLHSQLALLNLKPTLSAQYFWTTCKNWSPLKFRSVLPTGAESWYSYNEAKELLVAVVCRSAKVKWGNYQNLFDTIYDLLVLKWDSAEGVLCLYSSNYDALRSNQMAQVITDDTATLVCGPPIFNILNNVELPLVKNLGSSRIGAISFTSYFGPNVTEGLASIEKAESSLNNIACLGYEDGERVLWGGTQRRGKIWQQKSGTISEWYSWTSATWAKVTSEDKFESNITRDFLRPERMLNAYESYPISVQWGEQAQAYNFNRLFVIFDNTVFPLFMVDLEISEIGRNGEIFFKIFSETNFSECKLSISESLSRGYRYEYVSGARVYFRVSNNPELSLEEYFEKDPPIIRYADGTYSYNCYHIPANLDAGVFDKNRLETWNWTGIPLNKESMHKTGDTATIQYRTYEQLCDDYEVIFNDDGCGEAADLVCLKDLDESAIRLCLVHCKGAIEGRVSQDIRNFYTVCGQAQKSITVKHTGMRTLYENLKRRQEAWKQGGNGASRFLKGDMKRLAFFKEKARRAKLDFEVTLVQPGASLRSISNDSLKLLATTELYLIKTTQASFRVVVSP